MEVPASDPPTFVYHCFDRLVIHGSSRIYTYSNRAMKPKSMCTC
jgi:hypothetical protein